MNIGAHRTQKEKCFLKHSVETESISLSYPVLGSKGVSWSLVDDINQYWSITRTAFPGRAQVNSLPQIISSLISSAHMFLMRPTSFLPPGPRMEQRPKLPRAFHNPGYNEYINLGLPIRVNETPFRNSSRESILLFSVGHKPKVRKGWSCSSHFAAKKLQPT